MSNLDRKIIQFDNILRLLTGHAPAARPHPAASVQEETLSPAERRHSAGLMRVNHVGEICAQALYEAQGRFTQNPVLKQQFNQASHEEVDHLAWTAQRLRELNSRPSLLNPLWYAGAYFLGAVVARIGDAHSLGFVVETERQVAAHLESHLQHLPAQDMTSRAIVTQMRTDEIAHGASAQALGATPPPALVQKGMKIMAKIMTTTAYHI